MAIHTFIAGVERDEHGLWSAWIDELPGCAVSCYTKEKTLTALREAAEVYIQDMQESGEEVPFTEFEIVVSSPTPATA